MKEKTNLELFKNEILYKLRHRGNITMYAAMVEIYERETNNEITYKKVLDWFSDVPRETLLLSKPVYDFIIEYGKIVKEKIWFTNDPLENIFAMEALINAGIIPSRYADYTLKDLLAIIRVKEDKK